MLKDAYFETNVGELNKLITEENCKYLSFLNYNDFEHVTNIDNSDWNKIQKVSVSEYGKILGYFSANTNITHERISGLYLVKFKSKFDSKSEIDVAKNDLDEFIKSLINNQRFRYIQFSACVDNYACELYNKWLNKYGGYKHLYPKSVRLKDGKYYDTYDYVIYCDRWEL